MNVPAQDLSAERAVLAAMLLEQQAIEKAAAIVGPADFYRTDHGRIFRAIVGLHRRGERADLVSVAAELRRDLEVPSDKPLLASLFDEMTSAANVESHARMVAGKRQVRDVRQLAEGFLSEINGSLPEDATTRLTQLLAAAEPHADSGEEQLSVGWQSVCSPEGSPALPLPLAAMDRWNIRAGDLAFIGSRPGGGKTAMLCNMAIHAAANGWRCLLLSAEMPARDVKARLMANALGIDLGEVLGSGTRLEGKLGALEAIPVWVVDSRNGRLSLEDCIARIGRFARAADSRPAVVFLDYVQFVRPRGKFDRRHEAIEHNCRELKRAAISNMVPVVSAAQVSRAAEVRAKESIPVMADLKASGAIEEYGDHVALWHKEPSSGRSSKVSFAVWKQRQGTDLVADFYFDGPRCAFEDHAWQ